MDSTKKSNIKRKQEYYINEILKMLLICIARAQSQTTNK